MLKINRIPYCIGITGTIGSGKSLTGSILKEKGIPVLDTDEVVEQLYAENRSLKQQMEKVFGKQIIDKDGRIDRNILREIVFNSSEKLSLLEKMVHPMVSKKTESFLRNSFGDNPIKAVLVPLLFETGTEKYYDETWAIVVKPEILLKRLMARENISEEEALKRLSRQWSQEDKAARADRVIDNSGSIEETKAAILNIVRHIREAIAK